MATHLSVLTLHPSHPFASRLQDDSQLSYAKALELAGMHAGGGRLLWSRPDAVVWLIQSPTRVRLTGRETWVRSADTQPVRLDWDLGQRVCFGLVANPCVARRREGRSSHRVPVTEAERDAWLVAALSPALDVETADGRPLGTRTSRTGGNLARHTLHCWSGTAAVKCPGTLAGMIVSGVGPGKAYGAGLLIVRDAS